MNVFIAARGGNLFHIVWITSKEIPVVPEDGRVSFIVANASPVSLSYKPRVRKCYAIHILRNFFFFFLYDFYGKNAEKKL